ncbi:NYN domain-containing protein, partial [Gordonibacter pamelaeae]|uniref:NYN domain-containing protein n=1 Tax=Gordonibacter pamelaeae TaxID=471189 RepID=UPI0039F61351
MEKQSSEKRFALLIDADNVSAKYIKPITDELSKYGTVTYKRIYGDWTLTLHAKWKDALLENSITPIQQFGYTQGKNATDSAMIIDAMDILYTRSVEGFCIVSSDSDFTRLASRIRESGLTVIGMGEKKTPTPFRKACDIFTTLELLLGDAGGKASGRGKGRGDQAGANAAGAGAGTATASKEEIEQAVVNIITDNQNNGKSTGLGEVGSRLLKRYPDFDVRSYGTNLLSKLLDEFPSVQITKDGSSVTVELAGDDRERRGGRGKDAPHGAEAPAAEASDAQAEQEPKGPAGAEGAVDAQAEPVPAEGADEPVRQPAANGGGEGASAKKPRRSTRPASHRGGKGDAPKATAEDAVEAKGAEAPAPDAPAEEPQDASRAAQPEPVEEPPVDNRPGRAARLRAAAAWANAMGGRKAAAKAKPAARKEPEAEAQDAPAAPQAEEPAGVRQGQAPAAPKPKSRRKPAAKAAAAPQPVEQGEAPAQAAEAPAKAPARASAKAAPKPTAKRAKAAGPAEAARPAETAAKAGKAPKSPKAAQAPEAPAQDAHAAGGPEEYIRQTLAEAGPDGVALATLGKRVRGRFR